jgi:hypothetical protein
MTKLSKRQLADVKRQVILSNETLRQKPVAVPDENGLTRTQRAKLTDRQARKIAKATATQLAEPTVIRSALNDAPRGTMIRFLDTPDNRYWKRQYGEGVHMLIEPAFSVAFDTRRDAKITTISVLTSNGQVREGLSPLIFEKL